MTQDTTWADQKRRMQLRWPALTDADLDSTGGDREALLGLLQGRLGYAAGNAEGDLDEVLAGEATAPRDIADEDTHTGTSGPVPSRDARDDSPSWQGRVQSRGPGDTEVQERAERPGAQVAYPEFTGSGVRHGPARNGGQAGHRVWQLPALAAAALTALGATSLLLLRRRSSRKRLRIEVPVPTVPLQAERARELAYHAVDSGRASTAAILETAAERLGPRTERTTAGLQEAAAKAADGMEEAASYLRRHETDEIWSDVGRYVKHHPIRTTLVAVAAAIAMLRLLR